MSGVVLLRCSSPYTAYTVETFHQEYLFSQEQKWFNYPLFAQERYNAFIVIISSDSCFYFNLFLCLSFQFLLLLAHVMKVMQMGFEFS